MITKAQFEYRRKIQKSEWDRRKQASSWQNSGGEMRREKSKNDTDAKTDSKAAK